MTAWLDALLRGLLAGGLYALFAIGLALTFGVMRVVNLAHGDLIVLASFAALVCGDALGLPPLVVVCLVVPGMAALGYGLQYVLINRSLGGDALRPMIVTFGLSLVLQNTLGEVFGADTRRLQLGALDTAGIQIASELTIGLYPLLVLATAVAVAGGLHLILFRTRFGAALRATSDDGETVQLLGISRARVFASAAGLALGIAGLAGVLMGGATTFDPTSGPPRLVYAFEAVVIGGLGNPWGTLAGGVILGLAQGIGGAIDPALQLIFGHLAFMAMLVLVPRGLFPRMAS